MNGKHNGGAWLVVLAMALTAAISTASADVRLPAIVGDNMVLQQDAPVPVWGWAEPGEGVSVALGKQTRTVKAGKDGRWQVTLDALKAGGPFEMTVSGKNAVAVKNVLVGEVWVCSGQSNMAMQVSGVVNAQEEIAAAKYPAIRLFTVARKTAEEPQTDVDGKWVECAPETIAQFSAVGYFFGRDIHTTRHLAVGLVNTSYGGTPAEAWTSRRTLETNPALAAIQERFAQAAENYPAAMKKFEETTIPTWQERAKKAKAEGKTPPRRPQPPMGPGHKNQPCGLYNAMIAPLIPYAIRGAIWYQGESNAGHAYEYRDLFPAMIEDWRRNWGQGDFPFLFVQLANFHAAQSDPNEASGWAELREAQTMTLKTPKTGMAVIIDIGDADNIHPKNKQDVGRRLALAARAIAFGEEIVYSGPICRSLSVKGGKARLRFDHVGSGLVAKGDGLKGFAIAGADKKFVWAEAKIEADEVVLWSDEIAEPVAVRYGWANNPPCNLYNAEGLPASPFRTDDWPGVTSPK